MKIVPVFFKTIHSLKFEEDETSAEQVEAHAEILVSFLKQVEPKVEAIIFIFKNYGVSLNKRPKLNYKVLMMRQTFIKAVMDSEFQILKLVERSALAYNGCKLKKVRRKRVKHQRLKKLLKNVAIT